ncbi:MAG: hypothetical protein ACOC2W_01675 [bacterium]
MDSENNMNENIKDVINKYKEAQQTQNVNSGVNDNKEKSQPQSYDIPRNNNVSFNNETDPDLIVGYETLTLPSKGINRYNGTGVDEINIEYLTSKDEDILTTPSLIEKGIVLDVLLKKKIKTNINVDELLYGDKDAITLFLRTSSYGFEYDVEVYDPRNGKPFKYTIDLSKLKHKKVTELPDENGFYYVDLQIRKKMVQFRLLTSGEEKELMNKAESIKEAYNTDISEYNTLKLKSHIVSIDGKTNRDYINKFVDALPIKDTYIIRKKIADVTPGVDMNYEFETKDGYKFKSRINIGVDFFFPNI